MAFMSAHLGFRAASRDLVKSSDFVAANFYIEMVSLATSAISSHFLVWLCLIPLASDLPSNKCRICDFNMTDNLGKSRG